MSETFFIEQDIERLKRKSKIIETVASITINVKDFGAKGNGTTDDTQAFINMFSYVETKYLKSCVKITVPQGTYKITQDIIITQFENKTFEIIGTLLFTGCNAFEFKYLLNSRITVNRVEGNKNVYTGTDYGTLVYSGLKFHNCAYNDISIIQSIGFRNGLWLYGSTGGYYTGCYYNSISFQNIMRCYNGILCSSDGVAGWVNENTFTGGSIDAFNGIVQGDEVNNAVGNFHNQKYYNIGLEQVKGGIALAIYEGRSNVVANPRLEGGGNPILQIKEGTNTMFNRYITANYTVETSMIQLNPAGGSEVEADLRVLTAPVAKKTKSVNGIIVYEADAYNNASPNNTLTKEYNGLNLFSFKNNTGVKRTLAYYEEPIAIEDANLLNSFTNFTSTVGSAYSKFNYRRTGNNDLVLSGYIKGGAINTIIYTFPVAYRPKLARYTFPVSLYTGAGVVIGFVEIADGSITLKTDPASASRICLDGIRFSLDY